ncbi:DUF817 domain-containing protein [Aureibacillus halotolerans]|nr:DUF817 domain-containing protein [Aureibacillus halotolerans]
MKIVHDVWNYLLIFGTQQALSCVFPVAIFGALALTKVVEVPWIPRYDLILLICLLVQWLMYRTGLESKDELKVIAVFHLIGLALELYKVQMGSWAYPEEGWSKIAGVPLYSGFMYASVASYLCQAWRRLDAQLVRWPSAYWTVPLGAVIYLNFFTHHFIPDLRWFATAAVFLLFFRSAVTFVLKDRRFKLPLALSFVLIGFFIWIAENITTFLGAWQYPNQRDGWSIVHIGKLSSWFLLVIVSFIIVAQLKVQKAELDQKNPSNHMV